MLYTYSMCKLFHADKKKFNLTSPLEVSSHAEGGTGPAAPARTPRPGDPARPSGPVRPARLPPLLTEPACPALVVSRTTRSTSFSEQRSAGVEWYPTGSVPASVRGLTPHTKHRSGSKALILSLVGCSGCFVYVQ